MNFSTKHFPLKIIILLIILAFGGVLFLINFEKLTSLSQPNPVLIKPIAPTPAVQNTEVHSADGEVNLIMQTQKQKDGSTKYLFFTSDISGNNKKLIFEKTVGVGVSMAIPKNSWSPDNKYAFLREDEPSSFSIFVFKTTGENFADGQQYLDVASLFIQHKVKYLLSDVTGWDSPTLLRVITSGPSYWFDVTTKAFFQLARR